MATTIPYAVVDVFSSTPYKGNPLAVVDNSADNLSDTQMKLITRQFNLSETTFFSPPTLSGAAFRLRSFLPDGREVFGAGHNILGVWWYLAHDGRLDLSTPASVSGNEERFTFQQELGSQLSPVDIIRRKGGADGGADEFLVSLRQAPPGSHAEHPDNAALAASLGLEGSEIGFGEGAAMKPQVMSTSSTRHLIVPIKSVDALERVQVQREKLLVQLGVVDEAAYGLYLFTPSPSGEKDVYQARFFSPGMASEDPATGSAAGPLSAYLHRHGYLPLADESANIKVQQGLKLGRECIINVKLSSSNSEGGLDVDVSGGGAAVSTGKIAVPEASLVF